ncbi:MAG: TIGR02594 family protein [Kordia sp.]|uniref:TIGR02594 family protein n=1 Tax=Kordia sp. TaxID=1965332 RepID=UPI00385CCEE7
MSLIQKALSQYGVTEVDGKVDNPQIIKYFDVLGYNGTKLHDETAWCSAFVNWVAKTENYTYSGKLNARSWLNVGESTAVPAQGDVVILWRDAPNSWKGHVGFFVKQTKRYVYILGGNQNNRVSIKAYPKNRILDYRKLFGHGES